MLQPSNHQAPFPVTLLIACLFGSIFAANPGPSAFAQVAQPNPGRGVQDVRPLEANKPVKREIALDQAHTYLISLTIGQQLKIMIEAPVESLLISIFDPAGKKIVEGSAYSRWTKATELLVVAAEPGPYRLEARYLRMAWMNDPPPTSYEIRLHELRAATKEDRIRATARQSLIEAHLLQTKVRVKATAEARKEANEKAIEKCEAALPLWRSVGDRLGEAEALSIMAWGYRGLGDKQQEFAFYNQAAEIFRAMNDPFGELHVLFQIAYIHKDRGEYQEALTGFSRVRELALSEGYSGIEGPALHQVTDIHVMLGEYRQALDSLERALERYRASGNVTGELLSLSDLGDLNDALGEKQKALDYFTRMLQAVPPHLVGMKCQSLFGLGYLYYQLGDFDSALEYFKQTVANCPENRGFQNFAPRALTGIGAVYAELGEGQEALNYYERALGRQRYLKDRRGEGMTLASMGFVYDALGDRPKAISNLNDGLAHLRATKEYSFEITTLNKLGGVHAAAGEREQARDYYNQALGLSQKIGDRQGEAVALLGLARLQRENDQLPEARQHTERALAIIESLRTKIAGPALRASYFASTSRHYEFYIDLLMQLHLSNPAAGFDAAALQASERARARSLLELLNETSVDIREGVDAKLLDRERSLQQALNARADEQIRLLSKPHTAQQSNHLKQAIDSLTIEYQQAEAQIRATSPRYAALTQPRPLSVSEIQERVLDPDTLLLEYSLGEARSYLWAITKTSLTVYELPKRAEIESAARRVYELLTARQRGSNESVAERQQRVAKADAEYLSEAGALSRMLLAPVQSLLGGKRLAIVASGALQYIPFAALPTPSSPLGKERVQNQGAAETRYLIEDHEIVSLPSASVLAEQRQLFGGRAPAMKILGVFADPVFEKEDPRVKRATKDVRRIAQPNQVPQTSLVAPRSKSLLTAFRDVSGLSGVPLSRLLHTRREANAISALVDDPGMRLTALDFAADLTTATSPELGQYRYLHFATHGLLNQTHPELSGIVLSLIDNQGQPQAGFIKLQEIYNLRLSADLVVLSACQTALGKQIKGEGIVGLTRGFMYAGAPRVVASLWMVQDDATSHFMTDFYGGILRKGQRPAEALRAAQVGTRKQKTWQAPFYWAPFALQGDWR